MTGEDLLARAFLHETDHLYGRLYITHISALKRDLMKRKIKKLQRAGDWELSAAMRAGLSGNARLRRPHAGAASVAAGHRCWPWSRSPTARAAAGSTLPRPPVKEAALRLGLPVYQPERVRRPEAVEYLRALAPDAMVVVGYGQIIPQSVIDIAPLRHPQRACFAAAEVSRRRADPVGHRQWRDAHRRHHHADRRGSRHRRHAAEGGDRDRPRGERHRTGRAAGRDGRGSAGGDAGGSGSGRIVPREAGSARRPPTRRC